MCINKHIYSGGMAEWRKLAGIPSVRCAEAAGEKSHMRFLKKGYAIPKKGICDSAKRDMRFFIMGGAFLGLLAFGRWPLAEG